MPAALGGWGTPRCVAAGRRIGTSGVAAHRAGLPASLYPCTSPGSIHGCRRSSRGLIPGAGPRRCGASAATAAAGAEVATAASSAPLACGVQKATTAVELRAAAFLRAISFYTYPPGRSEFSARSHRLMKANAEWDSVTAKIEGRDLAYQDIDVTCYIASIEDVHGATRSSSGGGGEPSQNLLAALRLGLDDSAQLPAEPHPDDSGSRVGVAGPQPQRLVVGSLDLNVGSSLPSEELIGRQPQENPRHRRAYLSNVCVAPAARRLGVARALLRHAEEAARRAGVEWLYVHVVADNAPAVALYCEAMSFQVEHAESEGYARSLQRPRRLLLAKCMAQQG